MQLVFPRPNEATPRHQPAELREAWRDTFARSLGVHRMGHPHNLTTQGGFTTSVPERGASRRVAELLCGKRSPYLAPVFDHAEFWGRARRVFAIVAFPYQIHDTEYEPLATLARDYGYGLTVDHRSWYGWGTYRLILTAPPVADWPRVRAEDETLVVPPEPEFRAGDHLRQWLAARPPSRRRAPAGRPG